MFRLFDSADRISSKISTKSFSRCRPDVKISFEEMIGNCLWLILFINAMIYLYLYRC